MKGPTEIVMGGSKHSLPHDNDVHDVNDVTENVSMELLVLYVSMG